MVAQSLRACQVWAMFENRISAQFPQNLPPGGERSAVIPAPQATILPVVSLESIYQLAAERAVRDYELDRLFNPDHYGDNGSGI
jgi:hypothetical protein